MAFLLCALIFSDMCHPSQFVSKSVKQREESHQIELNMQMAELQELRQRIREVDSGESQRFQQLEQLVGNLQHSVQCHDKQTSADKVVIQQIFSQVTALVHVLEGVKNNDPSVAMDNTLLLDPELQQKKTQELGLDVNIEALAAEANKMRALFADQMADHFAGTMGSEGDCAVQ